MFSSVVSNVLTKGRIRLRTKIRFDSEEIIAVIVEGKSKGEANLVKESKSIYR